MKTNNTKKIKRTNDSNKNKKPKRKKKLDDKIENN